MESIDAVLAFGALAQETRLAAFRQLIVAGNSGLSAGVIAERLGAAAPTMSFHLKELTRAGLIRSRKEGRSVVYAVDFSGVRSLVNFLMTDCCRGDPQLCGDYAASATKQKTKETVT